MARQRVTDQVINIDIITGETFNWRRAGTPILEVSDVTPITFSSVSGYAPLNVNPSAKPTNTSSGDIWWDNTSGILFQFDNVRSKYLAVSTDHVIFNRRQAGSINTTVALRIGNTATANVGHVLPRQATLTAISIERNTTVGSLDIEIRRDSSAATLVTKTLGSGVSKLTDDTLDIDVASSASLQAYVVGDAVNTSNLVVVRLEYRVRG